MLIKAYGDVEDCEGKSDQNMNQCLCLETHQGAPRSADRQVRLVLGAHNLQPLQFLQPTAREGSDTLTLLAAFSVDWKHLTATVEL